MSFRDSIGTDGTLEGCSIRMMELTVMVKLASVVGNVRTENAFEFLYQNVLFRYARSDLVGKWIFINSPFLIYFNNFIFACVHMRRCQGRVI